MNTLTYKNTTYTNICIVINNTLYTIDSSFTARTTNTSPRQKFTFTEAKPSNFSVNTILGQTIDLYGQVRSLCSKTSNYKTYSKDVQSALNTNTTILLGKNSRGEWTVLGWAGAIQNSPNSSFVPYLYSRRNTDTILVNKILQASLSSCTNYSVKLHSSLKGNTLIAGYDARRDTVYTRECNRAH